MIAQGSGLTVNRHFLWDVVFDYSPEGRYVTKSGSPNEFERNQMTGRILKKNNTPLSFREQNRIFTYAENEGLKLHQALAYFGKTMDDLIYQHSHDQIPSGKPAPLLEDFQEIPHQIPMVSFFTGCGGLDLGFETAGFTHVAGFESNKSCCATLTANRPEWSVFGPPTHSGDVSKPCEIIATLEQVIEVDFEGIFTGGPPCQPFSIASSQRFSKNSGQFKRIGFAHEKNGNLLFDYIALIKHFRPACFLIENVPGLQNIDGGKQLSKALTGLRNVGYKVENPTLLNAANHDVPQFRERLFVVGTRLNRSIAFPVSSGLRYGAGLVLPRIQQNLPNTETRSHGIGPVRRYMKLDYGHRDRIGRVDRLSPCQPAKTVVGGGVIGGGRSHLHPEIPRTLSVRECARLQTFPDNYIFTGPTARQFTQVGNAVPPILAAQLGLALARSVFGVSLKNRLNVY